MRHPIGGGGGGRGMGGGTNVVRAVGRAVTRTRVGIQEPFPAASAGANSAASSGGSPTSPRSASGHAHKLSSKNQLSLSSASSAPSSPFGVPVSAASYAWLPFSSPQYDDYEWVSADGSEDERSVYLDDFLLGTVPSTDEVHSAVSAIQQYLSAVDDASVKCIITHRILANDVWLYGFLVRVFESTTYPQLIRDRFGPYSNLDKDITASGSLHRASSTGSDLDWFEPPVHISNSRSLQPYGPEMVVDTFHMLQNDPLVQRMVVSLSTDRAVWEAVMKNEAVRELRESCHSAEVSTLSDGTSNESNNEVNPLVDIARQIFDNTKAKFMDVIEKIAKLTRELFNPPTPPLPAAADGDDATAVPGDPFEGKLRASFMLTVVVLLIVVVGRAQQP